jgi:DNA-binding response OmpR family regulator
VLATTLQLFVSERRKWQRSPHMVQTRRRLREPLAVLVVEDDLDARRIYSEYLRTKGWTVFTASDGRTGLDKTTELTPDVLVLDLVMPRVDGWTVLKYVRESSLTAHIPIVVVSAVTDSRDDAFAAGCDAFLTKPCQPEVLYLQVRALARLRGDLVPA